MPKNCNAKLVSRLRIAAQNTACKMLVKLTPNLSSLRLFLDYTFFNALYLNNSNVFPPPPIELAKNAFVHFNAFSTMISNATEFGGIHNTY